MQATLPLPAVICSARRMVEPALLAHLKVQEDAYTEWRRSTHPDAEQAEFGCNWARVHCHKCHVKFRPIIICPHCGDMQLCQLHGIKNYTCGPCTE